MSTKVVRIVAGPDTARQITELLRQRQAEQERMTRELLAIAREQDPQRQAELLAAAGLGFVEDLGTGHRVHAVPKAVVRPAGHRLKTRARARARAKRVAPGRRRGSRRGGDPPGDAGDDDGSGWRLTATHVAHERAVLLEALRLHPDDEEVARLAVLATWGAAP
jgi:hypothetical protein